VQTYDTFATACWVLGLRLSPFLDGKPIREIFEQQELMEATPAPIATPGAASATRPATGM
jgi:hypothetical protein